MLQTMDGFKFVKRKQKFGCENCVCTVVVDKHKL
jgi:hypothetical protein